VKCLSNDPEELEFARHESSVVKLISSMRHDCLKYTSMFCSKAMDRAAHLKKESSFRFGQLDSQVKSFVSTTSGTQYRLNLPDIAGKAAHSEALLATVIKACKSPYPYIDALGLRKRGFEASTEVSELATDARRDLEKLMRDDRTSQHAPILQRLSEPSESDFGTVALSNMGRARKIWRFVIAIGGLPVAFILMVALMVLTGKGGRPSGEMWVGFVSLGVIALWVVLLVSAGSGGSLGNAIENAYQKRRVAAAMRGPSLLKKEADQNNAIAVERHSAILAANKEFDETVKNKLAELVVILRNVETAPSVFAL
jgi:hypothetical protein